MPTVSVIVPCFNQAAFLGQAIESVLSQTYADLQLIVVDDGSTDQTRDVAASFSDPRLLFIHQDNRGLGAARNRGYQASSGQYVTFLDSDDYFSPHKVQRQVEVLENEAEIGFVFCDIQHVDAQGAPLNDYTVKSAFRPFSKDLLSLLLAGGFMPPHAVMIRRSVLDEVGLFDESPELSGNEDYDLWLRVAAAGYRAFYVDHKDAYYRIHGQNMSLRADVMNRGRREALMRVASRYPDRIGSSLNALQNTNRELQEATDFLQRMLRLKEQELTQERQRLAASEKRKADDSATQNALRKAAEAVRTSEQLRRELDALRRSLSWRITRPFRRFALHLMRVPFLSRHVSSLIRRANTDPSMAARNGSSEIPIPFKPSPRPVYKSRHVSTAVKTNRGISLGMLVRDFDTGGLEKVVTDLALQFQDRGFQCPIFVANGGGLAQEHAASLGCEVFVFNGNITALVAEVRRRGVRCVLAHHCYEGIEELSNARVRIVEVIHNAYHWQRDLDALAELRRSHIAECICVSDFVAAYTQQFLGVAPSRIRTIENGLAREGLIRPPLEILAERRRKAPPLLLHLANAHSQKNHIAIIRAFHKLRGDFPGVRLALVGSVDQTTGVGRAALDEIDRKGLNGQVDIHGSLGRLDLSRLLSRAHVGLLPSGVEGFSIASLEFTYFGMPLTLSKTGAYKWLAERYGHVAIAEDIALSADRLNPIAIERCGLEPSKDAVDSIVHATADVLHNYDRYASAATQAALRWNEYSVEQVADRYTKSLEEILA